MALTRRSFPLPAMVRSHVVPGTGGPAADVTEPRFASTVMLVRDAAPGDSTAAGPGAGVEVFVMRRVATMAFAPRMTVFPGGGVDPRDDDPRLPWRGPTPAQWAGVLGVDEPLARRLVVAAIREIFEECGVLLAGSAAGEPAPDLGAGPWPQLRAALVRREVALAEVLEERGLQVRTDLLRPRARWVTPEFEPRRFDTFFFVARVPGGQEPDGRTSEAQTAGWARPSELLAGFRSGDVELLPPTLVHLEQLGRATDVESLLREEVRPVPLPRIMPTLSSDGRELRLSCDVPETR